MKNFIFLINNNPFFNNNSDNNHNNNLNNNLNNNSNYNSSNNEAINELYVTILKNIKLTEVLLKI